ncbi:hypothetical protein ACIQLJ_08865 [Microbacterium sp. NPDC091313]
MRRGWVTLVTASGVLIGATACSAQPVDGRLDEFQPRAEEIHQRVIEAVPDDATSSAATSAASIDESEWLVPRERQAAHWSTQSLVTVGATGARDTARLAGVPLIDAGWSAESIADADGSFADTYRLQDAGGGEWIVDISQTPQGRLAVLVQSPLTVRGSETG